nr:MAG TPA: hypothetical protein [Caudoviricetes sp.]
MPETVHLMMRRFESSAGALIERRGEDEKLLSDH